MIFNLKTTDQRHVKRVPVRTNILIAQMGEKTSLLVKNFNNFFIKIIWIVLP